MPPVEELGMNRLVRSITLAFALGLAAFVAKAADTQSNTISLAGTWRFQLDRDDMGVEEHWFDRALTHRIELPGALQNQGFGDDISVETKWTANVNDRSWYTSPKFEKYRQPGT
jgi:beta-galactosidase/beta-glucuronidase